MQIECISIALKASLLSQRVINVFQRNVLFFTNKRYILWFKLELNFGHDFRSGLEECKQHITR